MTNAALRHELKTIIDIIPERNLSVIKPLLSALSIEPVVIETDLTPGEKAIIEAGEREYAAYPEHFVRLADI